MNSWPIMIRNSGNPANRPDLLLTRKKPMSHTILHDQIDVVESGYEFLLAYAAQGRDNDRTGSGTSEVRDVLGGMADAARSIRAALQNDDHEFSAVVTDDARKSLAAISLVLEQDKISSELIDNLNASIHLRALLTDLFLLSEVRYGTEDQ